MQPDETIFDGRSHSAPLHYTVGQRVVSLLAEKLMPIASVLIPSNRIYTFLWRCLGVRVGSGSIIRLGTRINTPFHVTIGSACLIHGQLKARGGIEIGNSVEFVEEVLISTQSHNMDSSSFESIYAPVRILDHAWIGPRAIVLKGVTVGSGCAIGAGSIVSRDCPDWSVLVGAPAKVIKQRAKLRSLPQEYFDGPVS